MAGNQLRKGWFFGLVLICIVILSWVSSSFLLNQIFEDDSYRKPFFITYLNVSSFVLYLLPSLKDALVNAWNPKDQLEEKEKCEEQESLLQHEDEYTDDKLTVGFTMKLSAIFCILWFMANFSTNASLSYTSVASQTILSSTSSFFTLFIGAILHVESINSKKLFGLLVSFIGIISVTQSDSIVTESNFSKTQVIVGNSLALVGALVYGVYSTFLKKTIKDESRINIKLFLGFVGLFTLIGFWPILVFLDITKIETFQLPNSNKVISILLLNCLITFISDYCWAKAILLTSPLTVTVGLSLTIPFAMIGDIIFKGKTITIAYLFGATLVLLSFCLINSEDESDNIPLDNSDLKQKSVYNSV